MYSISRTFYMKKIRHYLIGLSLYTIDISLILKPGAGKPLVNVPTARNCHIIE